MSLKAAAISGVRWTTASAGLGAALQFIQLAVLSRLLLPADFGLLGMISVVFGFAQAYVDMGISNAIIHHSEVTSEELSSLYWLNIFGGLAAFTVLYASAPLVVTFYREP